MTSVTADAALSDGREHLYRGTMTMSTQQHHQPHSQHPTQSLGSSAWSNYCATELGHGRGVGDEEDAVLRQDKHSIPTAIVKPKYQKIPHDDRQLLTNAGGYVDYTCTSGSSNNLCGSSNNHSTQKRVHNNKLQAAFEEATRKKSQGLRRDTRSHSASSTSGSGAIVGVVTPRKKNYNENRNPGNNNRMSGEWEREMCLGGGGRVGGTGTNRKATDFNENNVISDKNNGRPSSAVLMKRNSGRRTSSARENAG